MIKIGANAKIKEVSTNKDIDVNKNKENQNGIKIEIIKMNYKIVTKYIKELSFKIPDAKSYFLLEKNIKNYEVNFDIKSKKINESVIEVDTNLKLVPQKDDGKNKS